VVAVQVVLVQVVQASTVVLPVSVFSPQSQARPSGMPPGVAAAGGLLARWVALASAGLAVVQQ
jgi:hypothetical protein